MHHAVWTHTFPALVKLWYVKFRLCSEGAVFRRGIGKPSTHVDMDVARNSPQASWTMNIRIDLADSRTWSFLHWTQWYMQIWYTWMCFLLVIFDPLYCGSNGHSITIWVICLLLFVTHFFLQRIEEANLSEQWPKPWLFDVYRGILLPSYMGIITSHY